MALQFQVNGKFGRKPISRLDDPERVRKDLERQRRITRLQQVRVASNNMTKTIREKVSAEKKRQLEILERTKQKEVDAWREHVLAKKHQDYRSAIFQVGGAHRAAREENERIEQQRLEKKEKINNCRKQAARSLKLKANNVKLLPTTEMNLNPEGRATAGTQTPTIPVENNENRLRGGSEKPGWNNESKRNRCCDAFTDEDESTEDDSILTSTSPTSNSRLQKTPPVILDVDMDDSLSETVNDDQGLEINDRFMQTNRKFSHVVRPNKEVSPERTESQRRPRFTQITDLVRRTETMTSIRSEPSRPTEPEVAETVPPSPTKSLPRSPTKTIIQVEAVSTKTTKSAGSPKKSSLATRQAQQQPVKRGGLKTNPPPAKVIDPGILRNQKGKTQATLTKVATAIKDPAPPTRPVPAQQPIGNLRPIPQQANLPQQMPVMPNPPMPQAYPLPQAQPYIHIYPQAMQPYAVPYSMPFPMPPHPMYGQQPVHVPATTAPPSITTQSTVSTSTTTVQQGTKTVQSGGRVQFYDHSNKYHRTYEAPTQSVQCNEKDPTQLNAMDHARIEDQLRELREQELDKLRKITHDRGQKALEREQIRRDCAELTEKLDAMTQQDPNLLPSDANFTASHRYVDVAARREQKMNEAMEQMLLRPSIITCPEVSTKSGPTTSARKKVSVSEAVNLGEYPVRGNRNYVDSTESCCSILLDYADDQSKQLRSDIKAQKSNSVKSMRLRGLLDRIETIREHLLDELKAGEDAESKGDNAQKLIDNIRQERADILAERTRSLNERESDLQQKEAILDQRLKDFYKDVQNKKSSDDGNGKAASKSDKPLEIIIKVQSDGTVKQYVPRGKSKPKAKVETMVNGKVVPTGTSDNTPREQPERTTQVATGRQIAPQDQRQNSFDSNSTAYRSLPPVSYKSFNPNRGSEGERSAVAPLHPLIAHYIDRLLTMTTENMAEVAVSNSDLTTPSPSIINTSSNVCPDPDKEYADIVNAERMERVENFIAENRSFVNDLEDSIRCQQQLQREQQAHDIEKSIQNFDKIWKKRLATNQDEANRKLKERERPDASKRLQEVNKRVIPQDNRKAQPPQVDKDRRQRTETRVQQEMVTRVGQQTSDGKTFTVTQKSKTKSTSASSSTRQMDRFEELTENCTARIAELTDLITKVREEKQRLVEVTLTSNSDGERQSTEYFELPTGQKQHEQPRSRTQSERSDSQTASLSEGLPLQKNKPTAASRDSGIADSRPLTAQGHVNVETEPVLLGSSNNTLRNRTKAPPATIRRYSPQLDEDDLGHELSTITEVETPGQSHIVAATPVPRPFPNFEQYAKELHLDLSTVGANESQQLQRDFNDLVEVVHQRVGADYREFPTINAYLHNITTTNHHMEVGEDQEQETMETAELIRQLRVVNYKIREFPKRREYLQKLVEQQPADERALIDSASLESSDSLDVEQELRQRRILRSSFRRGIMSEVTLTAQEVASSTRRESVAPTVNEPPNESGIDYLTGSNYSSDLDQRDPHWHAPVQNRRNRLGGMQTSTASTSPERIPRRSRAGEGNHHRSHDESGMQDASQLGKSLNLRQFLARELIRHSGQTSEGESSDESLRRHFLKSVLHSFSPNTTNLNPAVAVSNATGATNDRQKTSTPVGSFISLPNKSGSIQSTGTALFSGESRLSLVNYPDGTPPIPYEQQSKQSTKHNPSPNQMMSGGKEAHRKSPRK
ncbi:uncharacterized protein LOC110186229 [Drosophila serrata]|uniref:uncharacterized protein LOC110186229 n=1 Tax=Drosophila serrata TaxID=7274 RepID=UPI000A1D0C25|nr:uncharacterized protein LOC110186229 [Drosophila serrata]